jgi:hypothetical protein
MRLSGGHASVSWPRLHFSFSQARRPVVRGVSAPGENTVVPAARGVAGPAPNPAFERTAASALRLLAVPSSLRSWAAAQRERWAA